MAGDHTVQMNPYLSFKGDCEAAFKFYERCLAGHLGTLFRYGATPLADQVPADWSDKIMHGSVMSLEKTFWSARFGMVVDRFGIPWLINCERDQPTEG